MIKNKLEYSFGPVGRFAGIIIFIAGITLTYFYLSGVFLILLGGFVGFTSTIVFIDYDKQRLRFSNNLFGFIPTGKWVKILPEMQLGIKELNQTYRAYSRGNRALDIPEKDFRILLYDADNKEIMPLTKTDSMEKAKGELETLRNLLDLKTGSPHTWNL
ncbi:MAG: hypothetical protein Q8M08_06075 [Bacteroidales bacterium]|nr:hypothetical protein [Bacteroidales bacterium]